MTASTVEHLPAEVLSEIYAHCIPDPLKDDTGGRTTLEILEDVCEAWKAITSSTPELWTSISIKFHAGTRKSDVEEAFTSTEMFLRRSGTLPLCISLIDRDRSPGLDCAPLIRLLVEHSERWRYVHFELPMKSHRLIKHTRVKNRLSSLEELNLLGSGYGCPLSMYTVYKVAPKLTAVTIGSGLFALDNSALPWDQLVSWTGNLHVGDFLQLLRVCTRLRSCSVPSITHSSGVYLARVENVSVSQLTLELNGDSGDAIPYISLPALMDLTIKDGTLGDNRLPSIFFWLLGTLLESHSLTHLRLLQWSSAKSIDLIQLARLTPEVVSLDVEVTSPLALQCLTNDHLLALTPMDPGPSHYWPKLEHFKCSGYISFSDYYLHRFITYRWGGSDPQTRAARRMFLKSVQIEYDERSIREDDGQRSRPALLSLRRLRDEGFDITMHPRDWVFP